MHHPPRTAPHPDCAIARPSRPQRAVASHVVVAALVGLASCGPTDGATAAGADEAGTDSNVAASGDTSSGDAAEPETGDSDATAASESSSDDAETSADGDSGDTNGNDDTGTTGQPRRRPTGQIVFDTNTFGSQLYIATIGDDGPPTNLTNDTSFNGSAQWSPDGERIAFRSNRSGAEAVWLMDADGGNLIQLTDDLDGDSGPMFSPTNDVLSTLRRNEVHVIGLDGRGDTVVASGPAIRVGGWSPDGLQLSYHWANGLGDIHVVDADGNNPVLLTDDRSDDHSAVWSPDGGRIAFVSDRGGADDLYMMNTDGSDLVALTSGPEEDEAVAWSPDGGQLAFLRNDVAETGRQLMVMNADGSGLHPITASAQIIIGFSWSPDGEFIAYSGLVGALPIVIIASRDGEAFWKLTPNRASLQTNPIWRPTP